MDARTAYTALLIHFPAIAVGILSGLAGCMGVALPSIRLGRVDAAVLSVEGGLRWGATVGAATAVMFGLLALVALKLTRAAPRTRRRSAISLGAAGIVGPLAAVGGAYVGGVLAGIGSNEVAVELAAHGWITWPIAMGSLAMAVAIRAAGDQPAPR